MALTPQSNDAFFREVSEEVRLERMQGLARRYGAMVIGVIVAGLVVLAGVLGWRAHRESVAGEEGEKLTAAMTLLGAGNSAKAGPAIDAIVKDDQPGYTPLARLLQGAMQVQQNKAPQAAATFLAVAHDETVPQPLRDLALVRATALAFDTLAPTEVIARMKPLAVAGTAWFGSAGELTGLAYLKLGQQQPAGKLFAAIAQDKSVPQTIRARAAQLAADAGIEIVLTPDTPRS